MFLNIYTISRNDLTSFIVLCCLCISYSMRTTHSLLCNLQKTFLEKGCLSIRINHNWRYIALLASFHSTIVINHTSISLINRFI